MVEKQCRLALENVKKKKKQLATVKQSNVFMFPFFVCVRVYVQKPAEFEDDNFSVFNHKQTTFGFAQLLFVRNDNNNLNSMTIVLYRTWTMHTTDASTTTS